MSAAPKIKGAKSGSSSSRAPIEAPDSLRSIAYARVMDLLSEGPIVGLADGLRSVFLDETPVANADGSLNFKNIQIDTRVGTQDQEYIKGFPSIESELGVGVELLFGAAWTRSITNTALDAVRVRLSVPALSRTDTATGDVKGTSVGYAIDLATDGGAYAAVITSAFTGKTTTKYERSHRIDLPAASSGWMVRVRRLTPNSATGYLVDQTFVESITEVVDAKLRYPNSAVSAVVVDAEQFRNIPSRAYDVKLRIVRVPSNYDPETRTYDGIWDGTFKPEWTDNPAWVYFDLVTHPRYGLGHLVPESQVDKWALYRIAQYCDQLVPNGSGGHEPRFVCNLYLQRQQDAWKVLQDLASIFRGISYWAGGAIRAVADMPDDPTYVYTAANVVEGVFTYQGSPRKTRYTVAMVSWNDPGDFCRAKIEPVLDDEGITRYGIVETETIAFGCTSRTQAQRVGRWMLLTSRYETQTVSFTVGADGTVTPPGSVVEIADPAKAGKRIGGRVSSATTTAVTLDSDPGIEAGDTITCILPSAVSQKRIVGSVVDRVVTVTAAFDAAPLAQSVWATESETLATQRYRIISVVENPADQEQGITFTVTALQHEPGKFAAVEEGVAIDAPPITLMPADWQAPVTALSVDSYERAGQIVAGAVVRAAWQMPSGAMDCFIEWRAGDGEWTSPVRVTGRVAEYENAFPANYQCRVTASNALGIKSAPVLSEIYSLPDPSLKPGVITEIEQSLDEVTAAQIAAQAALDAEIAARLAADLDLSGRTDVIAAQVADITAADEWDAGTEYPVGDLVKFAGGLYRALTQNTNQQPDTNPDDWQYIGAYDSLGEAVAASISIGTQNASDIDVESTRLDAVVARLPAGVGELATTALVASEATARANGDSALASSITAVSATVAGKADASVLVALDARVGTVEGTGHGINMLPNATANSGTRQWSAASFASGGFVGPILNPAGDSWHPPGINSVGVNAPGVENPGSYINLRTPAAAVQQGKRYFASTYLARHRCGAQLFVAWMNAAGADVGYTTGPASAASGNGGLSLANWERLAIAANPPAGAVRAAVLVQFTGQGGSVPYGWMLRPMLEEATADQHGPSTWNAGGMESMAEYSVSLDVNGYISGLRMSNDGTIAEAAFLADIFRVLSPGATEGMEWRDGYLRIYGSGYQRVLGTNFGVGGQNLVDYFGPNVGAAAASKANATMWMDKTGNAYWGGSLSAGVLRNAVQTTTTVTVGTELVNGPFTTNGTVRAVTISFARDKRYTSLAHGAGGFTAGAGSNTATINVYRKIGAASETLWQTLNVTGGVMIQNEFDGPDGATASWGGSMTVNDTSSAASTVTYRAVISALTEQSVTHPGTIDGVDVTQNLAIISVEG